MLRLLSAFRGLVHRKIKRDFYVYSIAPLHGIVYFITGKKNQILPFLSRKKRNITKPLHLYDVSSKALHGMENYGKKELKKRS